MKKENLSTIEESTFPDKVRNFFKELVPYVIIVFIVFLIRTFLVTPVKVNGASMYPNLEDGQILILNKADKNFKRFDIIVADAINTRIIKRVIGLPGETVEYKDCKLYINGEELTDKVSYDKENKKICLTTDFTLEESTGYVLIPEGYYFVMGDNRRESTDSRDPRIGLVSKDQIVGKAIFRLTPFSKFGTLKK